MFVSSVCVVTVATSDSVADAPFARFPTVQTPVPELYDPTDGVADTNVRPAGSRSATDTPEEASGPPLLTVTVNVTLLLIAGVALLTDFVTARFASGTFTVADAELLPATGSVLVVEAVAVFVSKVCVVTVATSDSVAEAPLLRFPTVHTPVPEL